MPSHCGSDAGKAPRPISVSVHGMCVRRASAANASQAAGPELTSPPPPYSTGRFAAWIRRAAVFSDSVGSRGRGGGVHARADTACETACCCTSLGTSISTGPGRPPHAMAKPLRSVASSLLTSRTCAFQRVTGSEMPSASHSWNASVPIDVVATWPEMHTIGVESHSASSRPVVVLLMPGPEVTKTTPGRPVLRA